jgi:hypothetical protein
VYRNDLVFGSSHPYGYIASSISTFSNIATFSNTAKRPIMPQDCTISFDDALNYPLIYAAQNARPQPQHRHIVNFSHRSFVDTQRFAVFTSFASLDPGIPIKKN